MLSSFLTLDAELGEPEVRSAEFLKRMLRTARAVHPGSSPVALWRAGNLFARQVVRRDDLRAWHRPGHSPLQEMLSRRPSIVSAVQRPYIHSAWNASRRLAAIEAHYAQVAGRAHRLRSASHAAMRLATIAGRDSSVEVVLDSPEWLVHEGELSLNLFLAGERIYTLAFSLGHDAGQPAVYVGAVQGLGSERALEIYRSLTHSMHGLRPRDLLMAAFRLLCSDLGLRRVLAVSDARRVSASGYFSAAARVRSSYDAVWKDHLGELRTDGFYELPLEVARRTHESIPSRKRSEYRQRYEMLDRLQAELTASTRGR